MPASEARRAGPLGPARSASDRPWRAL